MTLRDVSNGPDWILWVVCYLTVIVADVVVMLVLMNTICKR